MTWLEYVLTIAPLDSSTSTGEKFTIRWVVRPGKASGGVAAAALSAVGQGAALSMWSAWKRQSGSAVLPSQKER